MKKNKNKKAFREYIAENFDLSKEITLDVVKITAFGNKEMTIENYSGILEYTDKNITILSKPYPIMISGNLLEIKNMTKEILNIYGFIKKIEFESN